MVWSLVPPYETEVVFVIWDPTTTPHNLICPKKPDPPAKSSLEVDWKHIFREETGSPRSIDSETDAGRVFVFPREVVDRLASSVACMAIAF